MRTVIQGVTRDEIEADLQEELDLEQLAVYGDFLQAEGDPRGELIALDLDGRDAPHRDSLLETWLGKRLATLLGPDAVDLGFIDLRLEDNVESRDLLDTWVATPAAHYARSATIVGDAAWVKRATLAVAHCSGRWLSQLAIQMSEPGPLDDGDIRRLAAATPYLERLEIWGERVFGDVGHPQIKSLRVTGYDACAGLLGSGPTRFPKLAVLDLAFDRTAVDPDRFGSGRLPVLRRLDLSSNEPGRFGPHNFGGAVDPFWVLGMMPLRAQLSHVRLPSVRSREHAERLEWALARMPMLREATMARTYAAFKFLVPERVTAPPPYPWPPPDAAPFELAIRHQHIQYPSGPLVEWLEEVFDELPASARTAWVRLFQFMRERQTLSELPREILREALLPLEGARDPELAPWLELRRDVMSNLAIKVLGLVLG